MKVVNEISNRIKNPTTLLGIFIILVAVYSSFNGKNDHGVIRSDGQGNYAYLPAVFIYQDASFQASLEAEQGYGDFNQLYLFKDKSGVISNKLPVPDVNAIYSKDSSPW